MKHRMIANLLALAVFFTPALASADPLPKADQKTDRQYATHHAGHHAGHSHGHGGKHHGGGRCQHDCDGEKCPLKGAHHARQQCQHHAAKHHGAWKKTLTEKQQKQMAELHLEMEQTLAPLYAELKVKKTELAGLMTAGTPSRSKIAKKTDEIITLKGNIMHKKNTHKLEVRKLLNEEQRVLFDVMLYKKIDHKHKH